MLWCGSCVDACDFVTKVVFDNFVVDVNNGFAYVALDDLTGNHLCGILVPILFVFFNSADRSLHLPINETRVLWLFLHLYDGLHLSLDRIPHFGWTNHLNFRILHLLFAFLTSSILPNSSIFDSPNPLLPNLPHLFDHLLCLADLLQIFVIISHQMGTICETIVLVLVIEEVEIEDGLVVG